MRSVSLFGVLVGLLLPAPGRSGGRSFCRPAICAAPVVVAPTVVQPVIELLVPSVAVAFAYIEPAATTQAQEAETTALQPTRYAAEPFDEEPGPRGIPASTLLGRPAATLQNTCARCHASQAAGGVRLWDAQGRLAPTKNGRPLAPAQLLQQIWTGRMPKGRTLRPEEQEALTKEVFR